MRTYNEVAHIPEDTNTDEMCHCEERATKQSEQKRDGHAFRLAMTVTRIISSLLMRIVLVVARIISYKYRGPTSS